MKTYPLLLLFALMTLAAASTTRGTPVHASGIGKFSIDVAEGSTLSAVLENDYASFSMGPSPYHAENSSSYFFPGEYWGNGGQTLSLTRTLTATLQADPGKIFDKVYIGLMPGAVSNQASGAGTQTDWTFTGGTYHGPEHYFFGNPGEYHDYNITGPGNGESTMYYGSWYIGTYYTFAQGSAEYLGGYYDVGAATFSLDMSINAWTWNAASLNPTGLQLHVTYLDAPEVPAPTNGVPDGASTGLMLGLPLAIAIAAARGRLTI